MVAELQKYAGSTVNLMSETREHTAELNSDVIRLTVSRWPMKLKNWRKEYRLLRRTKLQHRQEKNIQKIGEQLQESTKIKKRQMTSIKGVFRAFVEKFTSEMTLTATMKAKLGASEYHTGSDPVFITNPVKNVVLKEFHLALMNTIRDLKYNDTILDLSSRENTQVILEHLKSQVEDKLEQAQRVEEHEEAINRLIIELAAGGDASTLAGKSG
jgi:hypothetical protein